MSHVQVCYTSAGCNRGPFSADWGKNGLVCFAYSRAIAIYQPEGFSVAGGIIRTYTGHAGKVNCVAWISNGSSNEAEFVSGSTDHTIKLWSLHQESKGALVTLTGHEDSVTCVSSLYIEGQDKNDPPTTLVVSASVDSTVRIWVRKDSDVKEQQVLRFGSGFALSLATFIIPGTNTPLLACGCDDHKIHLYVGGSDLMFAKVTVLTGHDDWVRSVHFTADDDGNMLLASCAQDHLIRVWKFVQKNMPAQKVDNVFKCISDLPQEEEITVKETILSFGEQAGSHLHFAVSLESVLAGHENWVYSVRWQPAQITASGGCHQPLKLLSASMDKTMILWSPDLATGLWMEEVRVGDVGGNTLGFYGGLFSPCGQSILGHGYQGAFHQWSFNESSRGWEPQVTCSGHFDSVVDVAWSAADGAYILSASVDQTTRLHAPWIRAGIDPSWYEISRPQVHGYDLQCLAVLDKYSFASGSDEKLIRVFKAPRNFISNFCQLCGRDLDSELGGKALSSLPMGANVPALGLSNKAVFSVEENKVEESTKMGQYSENYFTALDLTAPPSEDQLIQNTLWPEEAKLYGHGYEIFSLAASPDGKLLASACKAAKAESANILLWDVEQRKILASLTGCTLTVTQMAFSHAGDRLLAVSRDRCWVLYRREGDSFVVEAQVDKRTTSHARIIWTCAWSHDDKFFFTGSRDKKVLVWSSQSVLEQTPPVAQASLQLPDSVTALACAPVFLTTSRYLIAVGLDSGDIHLYSWSPLDTWKLLVSLDQSQAHHLTVTRLSFRQQTGRLGHEQSDHWLQLASSGSDFAVRVYDIDLLKL
ncbi:elongator complex protein 2-like [Physella acuta]|uniref:elongator complex protein 2-like n=1 Tax=Physella acuta TaxID=109671 RepID=UPI0027DC9E4C|nr:elongator complex protein 2-like [Physella acuta]XP_059152913.1 elongator complex protein 2-like [Physella acuta]XP_059152914.1 elongator complex protein 2-like [Physella acuta]XP_059152915.1 elongator complex protein 2-like [Physella acuta]XP_059152917.1 elongator complex protein 2-like [Physella acuta]XP_059152918.1 elongator complex protein 2-like [Physella acuta]XP_059152919.1 elongator complex protein 2-like [Physella acuta]